MIEVTAMGKFVFGEFVSNIFNERLDKSKEEMRRAVNDKYDKSFSTRIYRVIECTINEITGNDYKGTDILYEAIEEIFNGFKKNRDEMEVVKGGLSFVITDISNSICEKFFEEFNDKICQDVELYRRSSVYLQKNGFRKINEKMILVIQKQIKSWTY